ncbi:MAG: SLATT domain-containing protein [Sphingobacteriaceae bacterium]|nr:MAG: SLATT domain-containing protein [Sphingobacteriaceae bacterium]
MNLTLIEEQLKESHLKVVWTHKVQEKAADVNTANHKNVKTAQIAVSAITTGTLLITIFGKAPNGSISANGAITSAIFSALSVGLQAYTKDLDFAQKANQHAKTANALRAIREDYLSLLTDMRSTEMNYELVAERRDQLKIRLDEVLDTAPRTGNLAYKRAQKALNDDDDHTFTGPELDRFLPPSLRGQIDNK